MRVLGVTLTLVLLLGACSGDDGSTKDTGSNDMGDVLVGDQGDLDGPGSDAGADAQDDAAGDLADDGETSPVDLVPVPDQVPSCVENAECNDLDPCTVDTCQVGFGCVNTPKDCSDGNACTEDTCRAVDGQCLHDSIDCADDNACTVESCDQELGCVYEALDCDDGIACTADGCSPVGGCTHKDKDCDDGDPCTLDECSEPTGCKHTPSTDPNCCVADFQCDDGLPCTLDECVGNTCLFTAIPDLQCCTQDEDCLDDNECTENVCVEGLCQLYAAGPGCCLVENDCDDLDSCTNDYCVDYTCIFEPLAGCCHDEVGCDDGEVCTEDVCAMAGPDYGFCENKDILGCCHGEDIECDDGNLCTLDSCPGIGEICVNEWVENCCLSVTDCDDGDGCTQDSCLSNECSHVDICCYSDEDCDDGDDLCTIDACVENFCVYEPTGADGCCNVPLLQDDFGVDIGWEYGPTWDRGATAVGAGSVYGNPDPAQDHTTSVDNFVAGVAVAGNPPTDVHADFYYLTSPVVNAAGIEALTLSYWRWLNSDYAPYMVNVVEVFDGALWQQVWASGSSPGIQDAEWTFQQFDISAYANAALRVRFGYNIGSSGVFTVSSWNLDDVQIYATNAGPLCCAYASDCQTDEGEEANCLAGVCSSGECATNEECDDGNPCTLDTCQFGSCFSEQIGDCCVTDADCFFPPNQCYSGHCEEGECIYDLLPDCCVEASDCDDGDLCTEDSCGEEGCIHEPIVGCCNSDAECTDDDECTTEECIDHECIFTPLPGCCGEDADCDDADPDTIDICLDGKCTNQDPDDCQCSEDADCDDGNPCTTDVCVANCLFCLSEPIPDCCLQDEECDDGDDCTEDTCSEEHLCLYTDICGE